MCWLRLLVFYFRVLENARKVLFIKLCKYLKPILKDTEADEDVQNA